MTVIDKLASSLGRRDETPNQELAKQIAGSNDKAAVKDLIDNLSNKSKDIQSDCIKTLYEIGEHKSSLTAGYATVFIDLLSSKNNRMQWGAMSALSAVVKENPDAVYIGLAKIVAAADAGSVITKDHCVKILIVLCGIKQYAENAFALYMEQLLASPPNQFPTYAESGMPFINNSNKAVFIQILTSRLDEMTDTKRKRVEKVITKLSKKK